MKQFSFGHILFPLLAIVFGCAFFIPAFQGATATIPSIYPDGWISTWNIWWSNRQNLSFAETYFRTSHLFHPLGTGLYLHTLAEGLVWPAANIFYDLLPWRLFSYLCFFSIITTFFAVFWFACRNGVHAAWAFFLGLLAAFHPYFIGHLAGGHLNLIFVAPLLLVWFILIGILKDGQLRAAWAVILGVGFGYLPYIDLYSSYFVLLPLLGVFAYLCIIGPRDRFRSLWLLCLACLLAGSIALPKLSGVLHDFRSKQYAPNHDPARHSLDMAALVIPSEFQKVGDHLGSAEVWQESRRAHSVTNSAESGGYVGMGALLLLTLLLLRVPGPNAAGRRLQKFLLLTGLIALCLSFGPEFRFLGKSLCPNPLFSLGAPLPSFPSVPARWFLLFLLSVVTLLTLKLSQFKQLSGWTRVLAVVLAGSMVLEYAPAKLRTAARTPEAELTTLASAAYVQAILDLSPDPSMAMFRQMFHHKKIVGGFVARAPRKADQVYRRNKFLRFLKNGGTVSDADLRGGWAQLKIEGVLVEGQDAEKLSRLQSLPWLKPTINGGSLIFFEPQT